MTTQFSAKVIVLAPCCGCITNTNKYESHF